MTGAEGGTHYQDIYPQKFRQELLKNVPPQAKFLLHLPPALIFHFFSLPAAAWCLPPTTTNSYQLWWSLCGSVRAGCRLPLGALAPCSPVQADGLSVKLPASASMHNHKGSTFDDTVSSGPAVAGIKIPSACRFQSLLMDLSFWLNNGLQLFKYSII